MATTRKTPPMTEAEAREALPDALSFGCSRRKAQAILAALPKDEAAKLDAQFAHHGGFVEHVAV